MRFGFLTFFSILILATAARAQGTDPVVVSPPQPVTAAIGSSATLAATVSGTLPITFQWFKDGVAIAGATSTSLNFFAVVLTDTGSYRLDATNSVSTVSTVPVLLVVTKRPQTITFNPPPTSGNGSSVTLTATASSGLPVAFSLVSGSASLSGNVLTATSGSIVVRASQPGDATFDAAPPIDRSITFITGGITPFITSPPADQTVAAGGNATLRATAIGTPLPTYQWDKDGTPIAGATSNVLTLANVTLADAARYGITATNAAGVATASATLTVQVPPTITRQPADATVSAGNATTLSVEVTAVPAARFQWRKNGTAIAGATRDTLTFASTAATDAGRYDVVVTNTLGSATSTTATLTVNVRDFSGTYFGRVGAEGATGVGQFALLVRANRTAVFLARNVGNTAALMANTTVDLSGNFSVTTAALGTTTANTAIRGSIDEVAGAVTGTVATNLLAGTRAGTTNTVGNRAGFYLGAVPGSAAALGFAVVAPDGDTLLVVANTTGVDSVRAKLASDGRFTGTGTAGTPVDVTFASGGTLRGTLGAGANAATLVGAFDTLVGAERLANVSVRTTTSNAAPLITGFVINGTTAKQVLIRAAGPTIAAAPFNVAGALADPTLQVFRGNTAVAQNDEWGTPAANGTAVSAAATRTGAFPFRAGSADAAISTSLTPAAYTAEIGGGNGVVLAEIYEDLANGEVAGTRRLINLSARGLVTPGAPLIAGFVISGAIPKRVLVRGIGATIGAPPFNVPGALPNPQLTLFRGSTALKANDDWFRDPDATLIRDAATRAGAFALGAQSVDASILIYLEPGAYTAQVTGPTNANAANGTGIGLVEVYEAP